MKKTIQVITIGNAFELVHQDVEPYFALSEFAKVDERHFGQKASFWATRYGWPSVVVCTSAPSEMVLKATYGTRQRPAFVEPMRISSSVCLDLLTDQAALGKLISVLDRETKILLAPYVHTAHVENLAMFLLDAGFSLVDYRPQAELVRSLYNKVTAQQLIFEPIDLLRVHRPRSTVANSINELPAAISSLKHLGVTEFVVKSAVAQGGAGIFFFNNRQLKQCQRLDDLLTGLGQNEPTRSAPFLIEERVQSEASPTVDIEITRTGKVELIGLALQRLYDGRYYTGFYASPSFSSRWWYKDVIALSKSVGERLADLGYLGPANVDFVFSTADRRITLIEVNPRRSALIDGFSIRELKYPLAAISTSVSVADYVNIVQRSDGTIEALPTCMSGSRGYAVIPVADGGLSSQFRWASFWAAGSGSFDSENILEQTVLQLQDPKRNEIGITESRVRPFLRIPSLLEKVPQRPFPDNPEQSFRS